MTIWFVTRHRGAIAWAHRHGIVSAEEGAERIVDSIVASDVSVGDTVIGTLPVHLAADICARGARYFHIAMSVPTERRGQELTPDDMDAFGASCREFIVFGAPGTASAGVPASLPAPGTGAHVCLVSDQQMANLLPILKRRPARVELVCTPEMQQDGRGVDRLARSLCHYGYSVEQVTPHAAPRECAADFHAARLFARQLREKLFQAHPGEPLTLNATGGTKALSSAFLMEFQGLEILYTDTQGGGFIRHMDGSAAGPEPLGSLVTSIDDYLHCQGYRITRSISDNKRWRENADARRGVSEQLAAGSGTNIMNNFIGELNRRAQQVEDKLLRTHFQGNPRSLSTEKRNELLEQHLPFTPSPALATPAILAPLIASLFDTDLLRCNEDGAVFFAGVDALRYLSGGWLEEWAWHVARACGADDCRCGVFVQMNKDGTASDKDDNELDLMVLHNNRLLIAECKTINWWGASGKQDILNKLDALGNHARGLFGRTLLVSARPLDDDARRRADNYGVKVLEAVRMNGLKREILDWMEH
ncbi:MAG: CRISPR-associated protein Csx16 [Thauera sp.]|jgi:putative CRISPR-associated protein (TIGR02620 family)|nr:CRISPR-associated protein Csx16 [Thauera sp.]